MYSLFTDVFILEESVRQNAPSQVGFRRVLHHLSKSLILRENYELLVTRMGIEPPSGTPGIFSINEKVEASNIMFLKNSSDPFFFLKASHSGSASMSGSTKHFQGLAGVIVLGLNSPVMITQNIDVAANLANGNMGKVINFLSFDLLGGIALQMLFFQDLK